MNFKERIDIFNQLKNTSTPQFEIDTGLEVSDFFVKNKAAEQIIKNALLKDKNIILLCNQDSEKTIISNYLRSFAEKNSSVEILRNISEDLPFVSAEKVIVPEPSISEVIKILELILCDYKTFIFCMNLKSFENVIESFRTLVALNCPNLTSSNVEHLIGISDALLIYFSRNEDGLFNISDIGKIVYKNNCAFLDVLYSSSKEKEDEEIVISEDVSQQAEIASDGKEMAVADDETVRGSESENDIENLPSPDDSKETVKVNKYKLLKDKVRKRKEQS